MKPMLVDRMTACTKPRFSRQNRSISTAEPRSGRRRITIAMGAQQTAEEQPADRAPIRATRAHQARLRFPSGVVGHGEHYRIFPL